VPEDIDAIHRRLARSGRVRFADPVTLDQTSRSSLEWVPFFIHHDHSDGTGLSGKLIKYRKVGAVLAEETALSLSESATTNLLDALKAHSSAAAESEDGSYLLIRLKEGTADLRRHDPARVAQALMRVLASPDIADHIAELDVDDDLLKVFRGVIRLSEMKAAVEELESLLETNVVEEYEYQSWCEKHSWVFGNAYVVRDAVREITPSDHLDLLMPTVLSGFRDIVELKRPNMRVLRRDDDHRNYYWASDTSRAIGQSHRYLDVLHEVASNGLRDHTDIVAYHPRATIVIGRSADWTNDELKGLHGLNQRLHGITVITYDHLLAQGRRLLASIEEGASTSPKRD
jgi:hypothetical protein